MFYALIELVKTELCRDPYLLGGENRSRIMSKSPSSPKTSSRLSPGFFTWRRSRNSATLEVPSGSRPTSTVSYLSTDFDATDVSS